MDKSIEIAKFQALLRLSATGSQDLSAEIRFQQQVLRSIGVQDGEIVDLIHDRYARANISVARAQLALASIRQAAGLPNQNVLSTPRRAWSSPKTLDERAAAYMRARGKSTRSAQPTSCAALPPNSTPAPALPELLVPYGVSEQGEIVHARDASASAAYACPGCTTRLVLHRGAVRAPHFAHKANTACNGETLLHITAKLLIEKTIKEHSKSNRRITLQCTCSQCHSSFAKQLPPTAFTGASVERRVGSFICDVVATNEEVPVLAVEILKSHAVSDIKAAQLELPWIELRALDVLEAPFSWRPVQERLKSMLCKKCKTKQAELQQVAQRWQLPLADSKYVAAVAPCWSCKELIIWYWWQGVPFAQRRPPAPVPSTVQFRFSKMYGGQYWMNVCPGCNAPQGDNFVFLASDSPFKKLPINQTNEMKEHEKRRNSSVVAQFLGVIKRNISDH